MQELLYPWPAFGQLVLCYFLLLRIAACQNQVQSGFVQGTALGPITSATNISGLQFSSLQRPQTIEGNATLDGLQSGGDNALRLESGTAVFILQPGAHLWLHRLVIQADIRDATMPGLPGIEQHDASRLQLEESLVLCDCQSIAVLWASWCQPGSDTSSGVGGLGAWYNPQSSMLAHAHVSLNYLYMGAG